ncbi:MAG: single-stranded-DNA-specific exonuclease RecJ [Chloroflexi bacterium]|nr:single-stranded-DNA-specific exonuclease RecJ [Chloroflexota bacterium]
MSEPQENGIDKITKQKTERIWVVQPPPPPEFFEQVAALGLSRLTAHLLYHRDLQTIEAIDYFFKASYVSLADPMLIKDMAQAVVRIKAALQAGERMAVYGDFDADGVTGCTLLVQFLRSVGAEVIPHIPHRVEEGYGLNNVALQRLAEADVKLVITVDCGVSNVAEIAFARELGMDVIVTDHHLPPDPLPEAAAILNVRQPGDHYPYKGCAGVGMAFHLVRTLSQNGVKPKNLTPRHLLDLVALGTVADLAPLTGENRVLVASGLKALNRSKRPGLVALIEAAGQVQGELDAFSLGFHLAPRINAAGRIDDAKLAYNLLLTEDLDYARKLAGELNQKNKERQVRLGAVLEEARSKVIAEKLDERGKIMVLSGEGWPAGVVGLVAGRLCEEFNRPVVVLEQGEPWSKGSARSIEAFNIMAALNQCADLLERYGGHRAAAGLSLATSNLPEFERRLQHLAETQLQQADLIPRLTIDAEIEAAEIPTAFAQSNLLAPFGSGNPAPLFLTRGLVLRAARSVGTTGAHLRLRLLDPQQGRLVEAIAFREGLQATTLILGQRLDLVYTLEQKTWQGRKQLEIHLHDFRASKDP